MREAKDAPVGFRLPKRLKAELDAWAEEERRSVASLLEKLVVDGLAARAKTKEKAEP